MVKSRNAKPNRPSFRLMLATAVDDRQLTWQEVSNITGIGLSTLKQYWGGQRKPNFVSAVRLATCLGMDILKMAECQEFHK